MFYIHLQIDELVLKPRYFAAMAMFMPEQDFPERLWNSVPPKVLAALQDKGFKLFVKLQSEYPDRYVSKNENFYYTLGFFASLLPASKVNEELGDMLEYSATAWSEGEHLQAANQLKGVKKLMDELSIHEIMDAKWYNDDIILEVINKDAMRQLNNNIR